VREHLGHYFTCLEFDKRGIGLSDRFEGELPTLEQRIGDIVSVMDAVGWERAHVLGVSEGGCMAQLFAVHCPERIRSMILHSTYVPRRYWHLIPDYMRDGDAEILGPRKIRERFHFVTERWGEDASAQVEWEVPSQIGNESFTRWLARLQRFSCTVADFKRQLDSIIALDAGDAPERIACPTLVMHVKGDRVLPVAGGRLLADLVPGAVYEEIEGDDHFAWIMPNWRDMTDRMIEFALGERPDRQTTRQFQAVVFSDIVGSTQHAATVGDARWREIRDHHDRITRKRVDDHGGRVVESTGDGLIAVFAMPSQAVAYALSMQKGLRDIGMEVRVGIHAGEIESHDDGRVSGIAVNLAARVEQQAADGEVWVSSTVRDMTLGGSTRYEDVGEHALKGIDGAWRLYAVR